MDACETKCARSMGANTRSHFKNGSRTKAEVTRIWKPCPPFLKQSRFTKAGPPSQPLLTPPLPFLSWFFHF